MININDLIVEFFLVSIIIFYHNFNSIKFLIEMQRETYSARATTNIELKLNTYFDKENHRKAWSKLCSLYTTNIEMKKRERTHTL